MPRAARRPLVRALVAFLAASLLATATLVGVAAGAASADDPLARAQARITAAQRAADEAAASFDDAQTRFYSLQGNVARTQRAVDAAMARSQRLVRIVRARALVAYKGGGGVSFDALLGDTADALDAGRRAVLFDKANARSLSVVDELEATTHDLRERRRVLQAQIADQATALQSLRARQAELQQQLATAIRGEQELRTELQRQRRAAEYQLFVQRARAAARAEAVQVARAAAARRAVAASTGPSRGLASLPVPAAPAPVNGMVCPVAGPVSFSDTYGSPRSGGRSHQGVDMFAARGTPTVAILSGSVFFQGDPLGGLAAYLQASDGNTYYYAHLDDYVGGARTVAAGEVIGHVGITGNASDAPPQLHFERRLGGPNGYRANPYPTVRPIC
jgi:septal ring factor EnvC (AmiA/AmiB activator)